MSPSLFPPIPYDTAREALAVFGNSNLYLVIGDHAEALFDRIDVQNTSVLAQTQGYRGAVLYLCTVFQHLESLPDQLAADALRKRVDWKYAVHSPLNGNSVEIHLLCEFRKMAIADPATRQNFQRLLAHMSDIPQIALCNCIKQDVDQVIYHVCTISRVASIWEAMNNALQALAITNTDWLRDHSLPYWYERYGHAKKPLNLRAGAQELEALAQAVGKDGSYLLKTAAASGIRALDEQPELIALRKIWDDQFEHGSNAVIWRKEACASCSIARHLRSMLWNMGQPQQGGRV